MADLDFDVRIKTNFADPAELMNAVGRAMEHGTFRVPARLQAGRPTRIVILTRAGVVAVKGAAEVLGFEGNGTWVRFLSASAEGTSEANLVLEDVEVELATPAARPPRALPPRAPTSTRGPASARAATPGAAAAAQSAGPSASDMAAPASTPAAPFAPASTPAAPVASASSAGPMAASRAHPAEPAAGARPQVPARGTRGPASPSRVVSVPPRLRSTTTLEVVPEVMPEVVPEVALEAVPRAAPSTLPDPMPSAMPSAMPAAMSAAMSAPRTQPPAQAEPPMGAAPPEPARPLPMPALASVTEWWNQAPPLPPAPLPPPPLPPPPLSPAMSTAAPSLGPALLPSPTAHPAASVHVEGDRAKREEGPAFAEPSGERSPATAGHPAADPFRASDSLPIFGEAQLGPLAGARIDPARAARAATLPSPAGNRRILAAAAAIAGAGVAVAIGAVWWAVSTRAPAGPALAATSTSCGPADTAMDTAMAPASDTAGAGAAAARVTGAASAKLTSSAAAPGAGRPVAGSAAASTAVSTAAPIDPSIAAPAAAKLPATTAASASGCQLQITSNASLADIWIDGVRKGKVPALLEVPCQATEVALRHPRYSADSRRVTPTAGLTEVALRLTRPLVTVKILSTPPGATVRVNGRELGKTPAQAKVHAFERGTIVLSHNGGAIKTMQIYPQADNTVVSATLPKPRAKPRK